MSDYFGALIQASGLSLEGETLSRRNIVPYDTPSPTDYGLLEVDEPISVAHHECSVNETMPLEPVQSRIDMGTQVGAIEPVVGERPIPPMSEKAKPATAMLTVETQAEDPYVRNRPASDEASPRTTEPSQFHSIEPPPAGAALVQAALRWVASGDNHTQAATEPESVPMGQVDLSVRQKEVQTSGQSEASRDELVVKERLESFPSFLLEPPGRTQMAEDSVILRDSVQHHRVQSHDPANENVVEVTIGSINVRVDAPPPPAVAVTAPSPTPSTFSESPPRSGLSRRTLWRI